MVSGVGVTLLRLTEALEARGHQVRVYSARYGLPAGQSDRPEVHRSPSVPFFLYPDVQWAFPRMRDVVDDLARFRPDVVHVVTEFSLGIAGVKAARQLGLPLIASAHTDYERYAARYGVPWAIRAGWHYLRWFYGQAHRVLCPSRIYEQHLHSRGVLHTGLWSRGVDPEWFHPRFRSQEYRARFGVGARRPPGHLHRPHRPGEEPRAAAPGMGAAGTGARLGPARSRGQGAAGGGDSTQRDPRRARAGPAPGPRPLGRLRVGGHLHLPFADRDLRQLAARGDGLGAAVPRGGVGRGPGVLGARRQRLAGRSGQRQGDRGGSEAAADRRGAATASERGRAP